MVMVRTSLIVFAVLAIGMLAATPAHAGAPGAKGGKKTPIKFKNIGQQAVQVTATRNGKTLGTTLLAQNGTYTVNAGPGGYTAIAKGFNNRISDSESGSVGNTPIYLYVKADNTATTITVESKF